MSANALLNEFQRLYDDRHSGILALVSETGQRVDVFFREGMVDAASSNLSSRRLGDYLVKDGSVLARDLDAVQSEAKRQRISFGEAVARRKLAEQAGVGAAVRCQAIELVQYALQNHFSVGSFTNSLRSYYAPARISFPQIVLEISRSNPVLYEPVLGTRIVLRDDTDLSAFPWYPQELCVLNELTYPNTFEGLSTATGVQDASLKRILGVLERVGVIETLEGYGPGAPNTAIVKRSGFPENLIPVVTNAVLDEKLIVAMSGSAFTTEQFNNLKVHLSETNLDVPLKVLTISSPDAQDGKSLISTTLSFSFAMDPGRRVLIIDCDLRRPSLEKYLGVPSEPGLMQYLANGNSGPHCYMRRIENLYFMTTGGTAPNPIEILSMHKMRQLIEQLKVDFDTIILDAPPYSPIADARIVTGLSDGLIMVVRRDKTSYASTDRAFKAIDRNKLLGVVFNDVKPMLFHTDHSVGYYQYGKPRLDTGSDEIRQKPKNYLES